MTSKLRTLVGVCTSVFRTGWLARSICTGLWLAWGILPVLFLSHLDPYGEPERVHALSLGWQRYVLGWTIAGVVLFILTFSTAYVKKDNGMAQCLAGLVCALLLGVPSFVLAAVPLLTQGPNALQHLAAHGNIVDLSTNVEDTGEGLDPNEYIVGIDVSESFLGAGDERDRRIKLIVDTISDLFSDKGILRRRPGRYDVLTIRTFAGASTPKFTNREGAVGDPGRMNTILTQICQQDFKRQLSDERNVDNPAVTDIVKFLETYVLADLATPGRKYNQAKVLLFTDLQQSDGPTVSVAGDDASRREVERKVEELAGKIEENKKLAIVAFTVGNTGKELPARRDVDLSVPLKRLHNWQSIDLDRFHRSPDDARLLELPGLYDRVSNPGTLYLKYVTDTNKALPSHFVVSEKDANMIVGLREREPLYRRAGELIQNMRVKIAGGSTLQLAGAAALPLHFDKGASNKIPVTLDTGFGLYGDPRAELVVGMPPSVMYRIPLEFIPIDPVALTHISGIQKVLVIVGALPLLLTLCSILVPWFLKLSGRAT